MMKRRQFTDEERQQVWSLRKSGQTLVAMGRLLGRPFRSVHDVIEARGGVAPRPRLRRAGALRPDEREEISRGLSAGLSLRAIARNVNRSPSTISREVGRNGGQRSYRAARAESCARERARRPKPGKLSSHRALRMMVAGKLAQNWAPEQISGWLKREFPDNIAMQISHETIYRSLFIQARGELKKELVSHLRSRRKMRRSHKPETELSTISDAISIRDRPAEVEDRAVAGHWEGDLIVGSKSSCIATLVERHTRYVMLVRLKNKEATTVARALARQVLKLPAELRKSLTWDRGTEMARHAQFSLETDVSVYFCDPRSPWQRGSNENTNGLLRQYFPKGTDLSGHSQAKLDRIARELNERPRQTLGWQTPAEKLNQVLH